MAYFYTALPAFAFLTRGVFPILTKFYLFCGYFPGLHFFRNVLTSRSRYGEPCVDHVNPTLFKHFKDRFLAKLALSVVSVNTVN